MKFVSAFIILAVAIAIEAAPSNVLSYSSPLVYREPLYRSAPIAYRAPYYRTAPLAYSSHYYRSAPILRTPEFYEHHIPRPIVYSAPAAHYEYADYAPAHVTVEARTAGAKYTAINRGAVHTADLPGHEFSASSVNLEAAPGTEW